MTETPPTDGTGPRRTTRADGTDTDAPTMADVNHTHPYTGETFDGAFRRGPAVADGGERDRPGDLMKDVDHTAPDGDGAKAVWERGRKRVDDAETDLDPETTGDATDGESVRTSTEKEDPVADE